MKKSFTLLEIADWNQTKEVELPDIQRRFVWSASQIENLWDSILRGYPIGALTLSKQSDKKNILKPLQLLDGQQRAVSIALGLNKQPLRDVNDEFKLFIDIGNQQENYKISDRQFIFRVITKSHPWGYQRKNNKKPLSTSDIRLALNENPDVKDYLCEGLDKWKPYDAILPVPFNLFIKNIDGNFIKLINDINAYIGGFLNSKNYAVDEVLIKKIFDACQRILGKEATYELPALYLDIEQIKSQIIEQSQSANIDKNDFNADDNVDLIEQVFVRLNTSGTPISPEELNYALLKNQIDKKITSELEKQCGSSINPARFITLAFRLWQCKESANFTFSSLKIKPSQFQIELNNKVTRDRFTNFLNLLLENGIIKESIDLIAYSNITSVGLPYPIIQKLGHSAPEILFIILYRIIIKKDFKNKDDIDPRLVIAHTTLLLFFARDNNKIGYSKILNHIWHALKFFDRDDFWSNKSLNQHFVWEIPEPKTLQDLLKLKSRSKNTNIINNISGDIALEQILFNKNLVLFAQRKFLPISFRSEDYNLDDSQRPYDWDHIFPSSWIKNKKKIPKIIKYIYQSNGNFRAWPYSLNRMDQDANPFTKLKPLDNINSYDLMCEAYKQNKYFKESNLSPKNLHEKIQAATSCISKVSDFDINEPKIINTTDMKKIYEIIAQRTVDIYREWYTTLMLKKVVPKPIRLSASSVFQSVPDLYIKGEVNDEIVSFKSINPIFDDVYLYFELFENFKDSSIEPYIYFSICSQNKNQMNDMLPKIEKDEIYFHLQSYSIDENVIQHHIEHYLRLTSYNSTTFRYFRKQIEGWLNVLNITDPKHKKELTNNMKILLDVFEI